MAQKTGLILSSAAAKRAARVEGRMMPIQRVGRAVLTAAFLVTTLAARAADKPAPNLSAGPGCLGVPVQACVDWLRATMELDEGFIAASLARRHRVDVNGRPLGPGIVSLSGRLPGRVETMLVVLRLNPDDTVISAEASLLQNLYAAQTEADYDRSAFYDMAARLYGRRCPSLVKLELYRFFENSVKPRIVSERQDLSTGISGLHRLTLHSAPLPYCGVGLSYTQQVEWRGSDNPLAAANPSGHASIALQ